MDLTLMIIFPTHVLALIFDPEVVIWIHNHA